MIGYSFRTFGTIALIAAAALRGLSAHEKPSELGVAINEAIEAAAFDSKHSRLFFASDDSSEVKAMSLEDHKVRQCIVIDGRLVRRLAISPDGCHLLVVSEPQMPKETSQERHVIVHVFSTQTGKLAAETGIESETVRLCSINNDGRIVIFTYIRLNEPLCFRLAGERLLPSDDTIDSVIESRRAVRGDEEAKGLFVKRDGTSMKVSKNEYPHGGYCMGPTGRSVFAMSGDGRLMLWDFDKLREPPTVFEVCDGPAFVFSDVVDSRVLILQKAAAAKQLFEFRVK
jgi:hypothetical protein